MCGDLGGVDVVLNVALFLPLGVGLALAGFRMRRALLFCVATTISIELLQLMIPGRDSSISDVLTNSLGSWLGLLLGTHWRALLMPTAMHATRLACGAIVGWGVVLLGSAWALQPAIPAQYFWIEFTPVGEDSTPFGGSLLSVHIGDQALRDGFAPNSFALRALLISPDSKVEAAVLPGPPPPKPAIVARMNNYFGVAFEIAQTGTSLRCMRRLHTADLRLRTPQLTLDGAFPPAARGGTPALDTPLRVACGYRHGRLVAQRVDGTGSLERVFPLSPAIGWSFLFPRDVALGPRYRLANLLWLALLAMPAGYWGQRAVRPDAHRGVRGATGSRSLVALLALGAVTLLLAILVGPRSFDLPGVPWAEWVAGPTGALLGSLASLLLVPTAEQADTERPGDAASSPGYPRVTAES